MTSAANTSPANTPSSEDSLAEYVRNGPERVELESSSDGPPVARPAPAPRWSPDSEQYVLGGVLLDPSTLTAVLALCAPADMYHPWHAVILEAMHRLDSRGEPIDVFTVAQELRRMDRLNTVGGTQYLGELTDSIPTSAHIEHHARVVADFAGMRRLRAGCVSTIAKIDNATSTREETFDHAEREVMKATEMRSVKEPITLLDAMERSLLRIEKTAETGSRVTGRSTGFHELDDKLAGLHPGQLIIVAARPAMGKSALALALTTAVARGTQERAGGPVLFISLEMQAEELSDRVVCAEGRVDAGRVRSNSMTPEDVVEFMAAMQRLGSLPFHIVDADSETLVGVKAMARRFKAKHGVRPVDSRPRTGPTDGPRVLAEKEIGLIVVDYLQLMKGPEQSRELQVANISRGLKALAKELHVPIVALSQLNRDLEKRPGKDRRPQLSDLRESGSIEQDADVVLFIYRDEVYNKDTDDRGIAEIIIAKQRSGPTATVRLRWIRELTKFESMSEPDHAPAPAESSAAPVPPFDPYANVFDGDGDPGPAEPDAREPKQEQWAQGDF